jgi:hypothetical protein
VVRKKSLEHYPEKWIPVFGEDHAQTQGVERDGDAKKNPALMDRLLDR